MPAGPRRPMGRPRARGAATPPPGPQGRQASPPRRAPPAGGALMAPGARARRASRRGASSCGRPTRPVQQQRRPTSESWDEALSTSIGSRAQGRAQRRTEIREGAPQYGHCCSRILRRVWRELWPKCCGSQSSLEPRRDTLCSGRRRGRRASACPKGHSFEAWGSWGPSFRRRSGLLRSVPSGRRPPRTGKVGAAERPVASGRALCGRHDTDAACEGRGRKCSF